MQEEKGDYYRHHIKKTATFNNKSSLVKSNDISSSVQFSSRWSEQN